ncbi:MAG TPA: hypothetical protein VK327_11025 [Candidatus Paceibacterota bacterium]|nr:hypothetical protein [Candidatus Paceibacterota bacterium]
METDGKRKKPVTPQSIRWLIYLAVVLGIAGWKFIPRPWHPSVMIETPHYHIDSTATRGQTEDIGRVLEILYSAYSNRFSSLKDFRADHPKLKILLYKNREEMRRINPGMGWAEAFYSKPNCRAYYSAREINPYHWMLHEAVHQLNEEVAHLNLAKWLDEGLAEYFSTSRIKNGELRPGRIDPNTYPVWWIDELVVTDDLKANLAGGSIIPLRTIITGRGGPSMNKEFNRYYLHWWTLAHFVFENGSRDATLRLLEQGGGMNAFEENVGSVEAVELNWHRHVRRIKAALAGNDLEFLRDGVLPGETAKR